MLRRVNPTDNVDDNEEKIDSERKDEKKEEIVKKVAIEKKDPISNFDLKYRYCSSFLHDDEEEEDDDEEVSSICIISDIMVDSVLKNIVITSKGKSLLMWDYLTGKKLKRIDLQRKITCLCSFKFDNVDYIACGSVDHNAYILNASNLTLYKELKGHSKSVNAICHFKTENNDDFIVTGSSDMTAIIWNAVTGKKGKVLIGHSDIVTCVTILVGSDEDNYLVTGGNDSSCFIWNPSVGIKMIMIENRYPINNKSYWSAAQNYLSTSITAITQLIDEKDEFYLLVGSADNTVSIWNPFEGLNLNIFEGHSDSITCLCTLKFFNHIYVVSGSKDNRIIIYNPFTNESIRIIEVASPVYALTSLSHDFGDVTKDVYLVAAMGDKKATIFNIFNNVKLSIHDLSVEDENFVNSLAIPLKCFIEHEFDLDVMKPINFNDSWLRMKRLFKQFGPAIFKDSYLLFIQATTVSHKTLTFRFFHTFFSSLTTSSLYNLINCQRKDGLDLLSRLIDTNDRATLGFVIEMLIKMHQTQSINMFTLKGHLFTRISTNVLEKLARNFPCEYVLLIRGLYLVKVNASQLFRFADNQKYPLDIDQSKIVIQKDLSFSGSRHVWSDYFLKNANKIDFSNASLVQPYIFPLQINLLSKLQHFISISQNLGHASIFDSEAAKLMLDKAYELHCKDKYSTSVALYTFFSLIYSFNMLIYWIPFGSVNGTDSAVKSIQYVLLTFCIFFILEEIYQYRKGVHYSSKQLFSFVTFSIAISGVISRLAIQGESSLSTAFLSIGSLCIYLKLLYYLRAFYYTGPLMITLIKTIERSMPYFFMLFLLFWSFIFALWIAINLNSNLNVFVSPYSSILDTLSEIVGDGGSNSNVYSQNSLAGTIWFFFFVFVILIGINLLIANFTNNYLIEQKKAIENYRMELAKIILCNTKWDIMKKEKPNILNVLKRDVDVSYQDFQCIDKFSLDNMKLDEADKLETDVEFRNLKGGEEEVKVQQNIIVKQKFNSLGEEFQDKFSRLENKIEEFFQMEKEDDKKITKEMESKLSKISEKINLIFEKENLNNLKIIENEGLNKIKNKETESKLGVITDKLSSIIESQDSNQIKENATKSEMESKMISFGLKLDSIAEVLAAKGASSNVFANAVGTVKRKKKKTVSTSEIASDEGVGDL